MNFQANSGKNIIITIAAVLIVAFFMPWIHVLFVSFTAWDMIFGSAGDLIDSAFRFIVVVIPIVGILIIYGAAFNNENYLISKSLLFILPILTLIVMGIIIGEKVSNNGGLEGASFGDIIRTFGIGFWLTLVGSAILPLISKKPTIIKTTISAEITPTEKQNFENKISSTGMNEIIDKTENKITPQQINKPLVNFQTMNKQRKFVLIAAIIGIISMFLPWISFSISVMFSNKSESENGFQGIGILAFLCFIISGAIAYLGNQTKNLDKTMWGIVLALGTIALLCIIGFYLNNPRSSINLSIENVMDVKQHVGSGLYIAALAAIGILASAYVFKSPTDNLKDSFNSMKKNIESKPNTPEESTTNTSSK